MSATELSGAELPGAELRRPERSLEILNSLRRRRRRLRGLDGVLRLLSSAALLVWLSFLVDWYLNLPTVVRAVQLATITFLLGNALRILLFTAKRTNVERLASQLEAASEESDQALITAVQLTAPGNPRTDLYSAALLARTVKQAEQSTAQLNPEEMFSRRGVYLTLLVLVVLGLPLVGGAVLRPDLAVTFVKRDVLLRGAPWPYAYLLEFLEPSQRQTLVAMGDPLSVLVEKVRGGEARVDLHANFETGEREVYRLERKGESRFRKMFHNVSRGFSFKVSSGDFTSATYQVLVRNRPRIESIELSYDFP
ncbi:MAG: hypothetical protein V3T77_04890, partial [Planctomycetota bacterium]